MHQIGMIGKLIRMIGKLIKMIGELGVYRIPIHRTKFDLRLVRTNIVGLALAGQTD